jgi:hypothetical protein
MQKPVTWREPAHSERRLEDCLSVGMDQGPVVLLILSSSVVVVLMTMTMIANAEMQMIRV